MQKAQMNEKKLTVADSATAHIPKVCFFFFEIEKRKKLTISHPIYTVVLCAGTTKCNLTESLKK